MGGCVAHQALGGKDYALVLAIEYSMIGVVDASVAHESVDPIRPGKRVKVDGKIGTNLAHRERRVLRKG